MAYTKTRASSGVRRSTAKKNTSRISSGRTARPAAKKSAPRQTAAKKNVNPNETRGTVLALAAVLVGILHFLGDSNPFLAYLHTLAQGLMGTLSILLPILLAILSLSAFRAASHQDESAHWAFLPCLLFLSILSAVQGFFVSHVLASMGIPGYFNFVAQAYRMCEGGGAVGSLAGYPLTQLLTPWGALACIVLLWVAILQKTGLISITAVGGFLKRKTQDAGKKIGGMAEKIKPAGSNRTELFIDDIYKGKVGKPRPNDLSKAKAANTKVVPLKGVGDAFAVPQVGKKASTQKAEAKGARRLFGGGRKNEAKDYSILDDLAREDQQTKNDRFMRQADREQQRIERRKAEKAASAKDLKQQEEPKGRTPAQPGPAKVPQQPKPSFFDEPAKAGDGKTVRQNTEQGKPSDRTYVKPEADKKPEKKHSEPDKPLRYKYPPLDLMEAGSTNFATGRYDDGDLGKAKVLIETLNNFSIPVELTGVSHGPAVTRFEIRPASGIKVSRVASYADDIAMALAAESVRIEAPIPGKNAVGVEVPNDRKELVHLRDILQSDEVRKSTKRLIVGLGKDNSGRFIVADLAKMPHVLIAGQTGSGKSVCINAIIVSILYRSTPDEVKMIMIDPKMVELNVYNTIPHLLVPVVTDPRKAAGALDWAVGEMDRRYKVFSSVGAKNIESYNAHLVQEGSGEPQMPQIVIIIDELADLMMTSPKEVEDSINRLAQLARAAGMHLVIATQRPSVNVITGLIKANIPTRIAFTVASGVDSRTILDSIGAEKLLGNGDMLYLPPNKNKPVRLQGAWVSEDEVQSIVNFIAEGGRADFDEDMLEHLENSTLSDAAKKDKKDEQAAEDIDDLFEEAVRCVVEAGQASISMLQRKLRIGYARAGRLIDQMAQRGFVSNTEGSKSREVLITREDVERIFRKNGE